MRACCRACVCVSKRVFCLHSGHEPLLTMDWAIHQTHLKCVSLETENKGRKAWRQQQHTSTYCTTSGFCQSERKNLQERWTGARLTDSLPAAKQTCQEEQPRPSIIGLDRHTEFDTDRLPVGLWIPVSLSRAKTTQTEHVMFITSCAFQAAAHVTHAICNETWIQIWHP